MTNGTKFIAIKYGRGIMLPADGRSSSAAIVGNNCSDKLEPILSKNLLPKKWNFFHTSTINCKVVRYKNDIQALDLGSFPQVKLAAG
jgi:hypothetical protein